MLSGNIIQQAIREYYLVPKTGDLAIKHLLQGYFDESGKLADSKVVAFAGCVATGSVWRDFTGKWTERMFRDGITHMSMKEATGLRGDFAKWDGEDREDRRDSLLVDLATLLSEAPIMRVSSPMTSSWFLSLPAEQQRKLGGNLQYCGFEACIKGSLYGRTDTALHAVCDLSEEYSEKCIKLFHKLRSKDSVAKSRCVAITFADDGSDAALQAADMVAYCSRASELFSQGEQQRSIVQRLIDILKSDDRATGSLFYQAGGTGLGSGEVELA